MHTQPVFLLNHHHGGTGRVPHPPALHLQGDALEHPSLPTRPPLHTSLQNKNTNSTESLVCLAARSTFAWQVTPSLSVTTVAADKSEEAEANIV